MPSTEPTPDPLPEPTAVSIVCPECGALVRIRDVHGYVLSCHLAVCEALALVNGE
ncbi:MAG: hypothetical protein ACT4PO_12215 [Actinomycetota bacterium]